jgi:hypothetical protein
MGVRQAISKSKQPPATVPDLILYVRTDESSDSSHVLLAIASDSIIQIHERMAPPEPEASKAGHYEGSLFNR